MLISCAVIPESNLVEVVQTQRLGNSVDENSIWDGFGYDIRKVDFQEICVSDHSPVADIADFYQDQEHYCHEVDDDSEYAQANGSLVEGCLVAQCVF